MPEALTETLPQAQSRRQASWTVVLPTIGSAGDLHPVLGVGRELARRGHTVVVATSDHYETTVREQGLDFRALLDGERLNALAQHPDMWHRWRAFPRLAAAAIVPAIRPLYAILAEMAGPRVLVAASSLCLGARLAQERLSVPLVSLVLQPVVFRSREDSIGTPHGAFDPAWPRWRKNLAYWIADRFIIDPPIGRALNSFRRELGLPPVRRIFDRWIHSPSGAVCLFPEWYAPPQFDWPAGVVFADFPVFDPTETNPLPAHVEEFLRTGDPPIVFTFGSEMRQGRPWLERGIEACRVLGRRALLLSRHEDQHPPTADGRSSMAAGFLPLSQILPLCSAIVHHGGIGTTSRALQAGIPQLAVPMAHDQPDNARRISRLGVGAWIDPQRFRPRHVAQSLEAVLSDPSVWKSCEDLAARVKPARGIELACDALEREMLLREAGGL
jgi:UDP:flavonoid glycosyltransferase YjiC (YdhE family)